MTTRGETGMSTIAHWIDNAVTIEGGPRSSPVFDPATGEASAQTALADAAVIDAAVASARTASQSWRNVSLTKRATIMFAFRELLAARADDVARIIVAEHGKTFADARGEVARGLEVVEYAASIPQLLKGERSESVSTGVDAYDVRVPLGVVAGVTPFNFPAMVPLWMFPLAVAAGNAFILKPSEKVPSAALLLAEIAAEAGFPPGVLNVVNGDAVAVEALIGLPYVAGVSFVGSTPVAERVYDSATAARKRVQALGGAKNHMIVLPDANLDDAAAAAVGAAYGSAGERCMAVSVVVAVGDIADPLVEALAARTRSIVVGPGGDPASEMGPLIDGAQLDRVRNYVDKGVGEGARLVVDGRDLRVQGHEGGFFMGPCLFDAVTEPMTIYRDEIFGPVLCVVRVENYQDAVALVNRHRFANGAAIFTSDGGAARAFARDVEVGMVGVNIPIPVPMSYFSFGGWRSSRLGDMGIYGAEGVRFYTRLKSVTTRWPETAPSTSNGGTSARTELEFPTAN